MRVTYAKRLMNVIRTQGFNGLKIQDMARSMNVSKATLYNYFSSKEDIIEEVANVYLAYIQEIDETVLNSRLSYGYRFQKVFEQAALSSIYTSDIFLNDLKLSFPQWYEEMMTARKKRMNSIEAFYKEGMKEGVFHPLNVMILVKQDEEMFQALLNPDFLAEKGLSMKQALYDFYEMKKYQLLKSSVIETVDDEAIQDIITYILTKVSNAF